MRLPALFMALLLVVLSLFPCQDLAANDVVTGSDAHHENDAPADHDDCTPLCSCACCGTVVTVFGSAPVAPVVLPLPPAGQTRPDCTPIWTPLLAAASDIQPPRS
ncbi:hypothetical protein [Lewinella sp. IMCC34183]|uniref:hypothetical protein n=1 Tax=Lewinella sp. IMCC34183 TaxID=2248762 RepID=UPI000E24C255|nr:hypothetical protein [Lewinella sp. IMCC34183]